ncbi:adenine phosphoribosyltransferase [Campylobacter lari]|uniref:Adenine phosphoribosyltransferase n=1 Tax=Campylobacter lari TaxID=201 RepID=A0A698FUQ9_CAMLA|nr:adenine phosphoribosyltransferase [Campylobacter lari]AJD06206.1 adenine phosphoribosyltransferase [Campylobacter lari RM16712]ECW8955313.1 adenine phosphoribosyltransferase [Campylobacter lari]MBT0794828.1 adenine phosphoribosyltransferase [Campylobacter lari]MBT0832054.1 adenine phosphoribosyltransferase [Campylobacter lari]MCR6511579.1 adenine phosphoribosyltransferase [Campylobacter lari]
MIKEQDKKYLLDSIRAIKDFPKEGIIFRDITTLLNNKEAFTFLMDHLVKKYQNAKLDYIVGIESRGFIFGAALSARLKLPFVPIRKPGKLPSKCLQESYSLEYGNDTIEIHIDAFNNQKANVLLIDDLIATGGTAIAAVKLIEKLNAKCIEACFLLELKDLDGAKELAKLTSVYSVLEV